jgi:hypothetical protein
MIKNRTTYEQIENILHFSSADRVILFAGHNSGGIPRPSSPFWVSAIFWCAKHFENSDTLSQYQNIPTDAHFITTLLDCERQSTVELDIAYLPECQKRRYLEAEGVKHLLLFFICIKENKFLYLSVAKYTDEPFTEVEITKIGLRVGIIKESI